MGSGSTKLMHQSEWVSTRSKGDTISMIEQCVTKIYSEKGLFCGEGGEQFLRRDRVELEVYLEDIPDFGEKYLAAFTLKRPYSQPYDLRPYVAYQLARLLWLSTLVDTELEGRFLLGLRDRHTPIIQLVAEKAVKVDRRVLTEVDVRVNILGDREIQGFMDEKSEARRELGPRCAFAEALLDADWLEAKQAKNPTMEFLNGNLQRLFRKKRINDLPDAPSLAEFEAANLPALIRAYYDLLYRSALWNQYREAKEGKPPVVPSAPEPVAAKAPDAYPEAAPAPMVMWPVDRDPYDYGNQSHMLPPQPLAQPPQMVPTTWAQPVGIMQGSRPSYAPSDSAIVAIDHGERPVADPYNPSGVQLPDWSRTTGIPSTNPQGSHNSYAGPMYQMFLPNQYNY